MNTTVLQALSANDAGPRTAPLAWIAAVTRMLVVACLAAARRHRSAIADDMAQLKRLPSIAAKALVRGAQWTPEDRREARESARSLMRVGVLGIVLVMPGGLLLVPLVGVYGGRRACEGGRS